MKRVHVAVIGLGSAGEAAARALAGHGLDVVGFESDLIGGECPFVACMPSKALLYDAHKARRSADADERWVAAVERRDEVVDQRDDRGHADELRSAGVEIVRGAATLVGDRHVGSDGQVWSAEHVILATGSEPVVPNIAGMAHDRVWTAFDALTSDARPDRLLIVGAGPVGCELADVFAGFGSDVSLIDVADRLLPDHDADVADHFERAVRGLGVDLRLGVEVDEVRHLGDVADVRLSDGRRVEVDRVLLAVGQSPRLAGLGLGTIGLPDDEIPDIDSHRRVIGHEWLWVAGDLNGRHPWTHGANRDAEIIVAAVMGQPKAATDAAMPRATFTDPPAAHVGTAATDDNVHLRGVGRWSDVARWSTDDLDDGLVVVAVDSQSGSIVGCSAVGHLADEIIATATTLVHFGIGIEDAATQVFAFPTVSQVLEVAIGDAAQRWREQTAP